jgi:hypothetical protein
MFHRTLLKVEVPTCGPLISIGRAPTLTVTKTICFWRGPTGSVSTFVFIVEIANARWRVLARGRVHRVEPDLGMRSATHSP